MVSSLPELHRLLAKRAAQVAQFESLVTDVMGRLPGTSSCASRAFCSLVLAYLAAICLLDLATTSGASGCNNSQWVVISPPNCCFKGWQGLPPANHPFLVADMRSTTIT